MKKNIVALTLALSMITVSVPKKAEAGLLVFGTGLMAGDLINGTLGAIIATPIVVGGVVAMLLGSLIPGGIIVLLDGEDQINPDTMSDGLAQKYNFIEDKEVLNNLSYVISKKAENTAVENISFGDGNVQPGKRVSLNEQTVRSILAPADLEESQIQVIIQDLK